MAVVRRVGTAAAWPAFGLVLGGYGSITGSSSGNLWAGAGVAQPQISTTTNGTATTMHVRAQTSLPIDDARSSDDSRNRFNRRVAKICWRGCSGGFDLLVEAVSGW